MKEKKTPEAEKTKKVGRPRKASTIVQRQLNVYLPDMIMVKEWKQLAKENNQSISKFVISRVEDSLKEHGVGPRYSRHDLMDRLHRLERENRNLQNDLEMKTKAYNLLDIEMREMRNRPFLTPLAEGARQISRKLISLIRSRGRLEYDELLPALDINPTQTDLIKSVTTQLEHLVHAGVVKQDLKGWEWVQ